MSKLAKRVLLYILTLSFVLLSVPFSIDIINADTLIPEIIGYNVTIYSQDKDYTLRSLGTFSGTISNYPGSYTCAAWYNSGGNHVCERWRTANSSGSSLTQSNLSISISSGNISYDTYLDKLYEYEIIFNDNYVGYIELTPYVSQSAYSNIKLYLNGNSISFRSEKFYDSIDVIDSDLSFPSYYIGGNEAIQVAIQNYDIDIYQMNLINHLLLRGANVMKDNNFNTSLFNFLTFKYPMFENNPSNNATNAAGLFQPANSTYVCIYLINTYTNLFSTSRFTPSGYGSYTLPTFTRFNPYILTGQMSIQGYKAITSNSDTFYTYSYNYGTLSNVVFIPLYYGPIELCPDEFLYYINQVKPLDENLNNTSNDIDNTSNTFDQTITDYDTVEQQLTNQFNTNMNQIDFTGTPSGIFGNNFMNSMLWTTQRFNEIITNTPFGDLLTFSLTVGLALLLIGRIL